MAIQRPFFSVIIPTLNEEKFLPKLLADLKKQHYAEFEIIVVDGNSDDKTKEEADIFKNDLRLSFFTGKKRNVAYQRNFGAAKANGQYLVFLDADVRIPSQFTKKLYDGLMYKPYLIIIPRYQVQERLFPETNLFSFINFLMEVSQKTSKPFIFGGGFIFEKNYFQRLGGFNDELYLSEDQDIVQRAKKFGVTVKVLKTISIKLSLRRIRREGRREVLRKSLISTIQTLKTGGIKTKPFDYQMGGAYHMSQNHRPDTMRHIVKEYFRKIKKNLPAFE